jgi:methylated-DNA-protein-cysteine methyltransferase related protein
VARFEDAVVAVLDALKAGDVLTYGEVAAEAGYPGAARAVGNLLRSSDLDLPWWRVVGSGGHLRSPDPARQALLLAEEGVTVAHGRVRGLPSG